MSCNESSKGTTLKLNIRSNYFRIFLVLFCHTNYSRPTKPRLNQWAYFVFQYSTCDITCERVHKENIWNEHFVGLYDSSCGDVTLVDDTLRLMTINHFLLYLVHHIGSAYNSHLHSFLSNGYLQLELMLCHVCRMLYLHTRCVTFFVIVPLLPRQINNTMIFTRLHSPHTHTQRERMSRPVYVLISFYC